MATEVVRGGDLIADPPSIISGLGGKIGEGGRLIGTLAGVVSVDSPSDEEILACDLAVGSTSGVIVEGSLNTIGEIIFLVESDGGVELEVP